MSRKREIPFDFATPWDGADALIWAEGHNGRPLYVSRKALAEKSSYFQGLFFGQFLEAAKETLKLDEISYDVLLEILRFVHHDEMDWTLPEKYTIPLFMELHKAAHLYFITELDSHLWNIFRNFAPVEKYIVFNRLNMEEKKMKLVEESSEESLLFLNDNYHPLLSGADVLFIAHQKKMKKKACLHKRPLSRCDSFYEFS